VNKAPNVVRRGCNRNLRSGSGASRGCDLGGVPGGMAAQPPGQRGPM